jgi:HK97 family phage major capsid protein
MPPAPAGITTGSFQGVPFPADVQAQIINLLISGAPLADSFTRQQTNRSSIAWPTAKPTGYAWLRELEQFPTIDVGDDAYVVAVAKIGGICDLANEAWDDSSFNMSAAFATLLQDSLSRDLDLGLLNGSGPPEPVGLLGVAPETAGDDLLAATAKARGEIADAGGTPDTIALSGTALAEADADRDANGQLVYPAGFAAAASLAPVVVPGLPVPLVYDSARCFLVVRDDARVEISTDWHFDRDATSIRIKARVALAIPDVPKAVRQLDVGDDSTRRAAEPGSTKRHASKSE